jgi:predicted TIM-barrel fold metal-dependent hydrolase
MMTPSSDSPPDCTLALFPVNAIVASADWVFSRIPVRFPELRICLSEGALSWVPMMLERLRRNTRLRDATLTWRDIDETPEDVFRRAFWFCSIEDRYGIEMRNEIGIDRIMIEMDYPHVDSTWPTTQEVVEEELGHLPESDIHKIAYENACNLYRHPLDAVENMKSR